MSDNSPTSLPFFENEWKAFTRKKVQEYLQNLKLREDEQQLLIASQAKLLRLQHEILRNRRDLLGMLTDRTGPNYRLFHAGDHAFPIAQLRLLEEQKTFLKSLDKLTIEDTYN